MIEIDDRRLRKTESPRWFTWNPPEEAEVIEFYQRQVKFLENLLAQREKKAGRAAAAQRPVFSLQDSVLSSPETSPAQKFELRNPEVELGKGRF